MQFFTKKETSGKFILFLALSLSGKTNVYAKSNNDN